MRRRVRDDQRDERRTAEPSEDQPYDDDAYDEAAGEAYDEQPYDDGEPEDDGAYDEERRRRAPADRRAPRTTLPANLAAQAGMRHIADLTGKPLCGVTSLKRADDGWVVGIEVVEDRRIPSSADILGVYEAEIDMEGSLMGYRRTERYARGRGDTGGVS